MAVFFDHAKRKHKSAKGADWIDDAFVASMLAYERRLRALRDEIFESNIISEASWPLLQELFAAHLAGEKLRTKQVCASSGLPQTTVLRYLNHLEKFDVIYRERDPEDDRVTLVSITQSAAFWMREYYAEVVKAEQRLEVVGDGILNFGARPKSKMPGNV